MSKSTKSAASAAAATSRVTTLAQAVVNGEMQKSEILDMFKANQLTPEEYGEVRELIVALDNRKPNTVKEVIWDAPNGDKVPMLEFCGDYKSFRLSASKVAAVLDTSIHPAMRAFATKNGRVC